MGELQELQKSYDHGNGPWFSVKCRVLLGIELTNFEIISISECEQREDNDSDKYSGELVPIIARDAFDEEATKFLYKYYPLALKEPVPVPIRQIAEDMGLTIISEDMGYRVSREYTKNADGNNFLRGIMYKSMLQ